VITTVVRTFNNIVLDLEVVGLKWFLNRITDGDPEAMDRAEYQFKAVREYVYVHPFQSWNPLFVFNDSLTAELRERILNASQDWEASRAIRDAKRREQYEALKKRILAERAKLSDQTPIASAFDGTAIPAKRVVRGKSRVTSVPFCTDGVGDPA